MFCHAVIPNARQATVEQKQLTRELKDFVNHCAQFARKKSIHRRLFKSMSLLESEIVANTVQRQSHVQEQRLALLYIYIHIYVIDIHANL